MVTYIISKAVVAHGVKKNVVENRHSQLEQMLGEVVTTKYAQIF